MDRDRRRVDLERISDVVTDRLGSTPSLIVHTLLFAAVFGLVLLNVAADEVMLVLTTAVSLEAIYLSIFIQRSTNRQAVRIERAVEEIRRNTEATLERLAALTQQEIDDVQQVVEEIDVKVDALGLRIERALKNGD